MSAQLNRIRAIAAQIDELGPADRERVVDLCAEAQAIDMQRVGDADAEWTAAIRGIREACEHWKARWS